VIHKTKGVVFRFTRYGETSIIVTIFTEVFGLQSYIINGVRSKTARNKIALYQPLMLLDLVVYHREHANLERIKEVKCLYPYSTLLTDIHKSTIAMFLTEVLNKTVKEESHTSEMFEFISTSLMSLDTMKEGFENFHLIFLLKLSRLLGFGANHNYEVVGGKMTSQENEKVLQVLLNMQYTDRLQLSVVQRREILDVIVKFYADHIENFGELKSTQVLKEVLS
jgi:DNA repair protein RecO (recombination protein O)